MEICWVKSKVSYRIRKLRESKDFSQENVAADLKITTSAYSKIERGVTDPSIGRLEQIARILGVDVTYFFHDNSEAQDSGNKYGFAKMGDFEDLNHLVKQLKQEVEKLKKDTNALTTAFNNLRKKK